MTMTSLFNDMAGDIPFLKRKPPASTDYTPPEEEPTFQEVFKEE